VTIERQNPKSAIIRLTLLTTGLDIFLQLDELVMSIIQPLYDTRMNKETGVIIQNGHHEQKCDQ